MSRKKVNYSTEEIKNNFKYLYIKENEMFAAKAEMPFNDNDDIYVFTKLENYINDENKWFRASELAEG